VQDERSDEELLVAVGAGPGALPEFYRRHVAKVTGMGVRRFDSPADEAVFSVLPGTDGGLLFGRVGNSRAQQVTATFPRSGQTVSTPVAASGFFAVTIPDRSMRSLMIAITPDPAKPVPTKDGRPILSFQLDRVPEISVLALDGHGRVAARGVAEPEPGGPTPTTGPTR
jgi:hypothetical protein